MGGRGVDEGVWGFGKNGKDGGDGGDEGVGSLGIVIVVFSRYLSVECLSCNAVLPSITHGGTKRCV